MRFNDVLIASFCGFAALVGCQMVGPASRLLDVGSVPPVTAIPAMPAAAGGVSSAPGTLEIAVRWPQDVPSGYRTQLIRPSTNQITLDVTDSTGNSVATASISRTSASSTVATTSLAVSAGSYDISAQAFDSENGTSTEIGQANAVAIHVLSGGIVPVALTLAPLDAPTISSISVDAGAVGQTVTLTGATFSDYTDSFGVAQAPTVYFGRIAAPTTVVSGTELTATVPVGATVGTVSVVMDGATSSTNLPYYVVNGLSMAASKSSWDTTPATECVVLEGATTSLTATYSFALASGDSLSNYPPAPSVAWTAASGVGTVSSSGVFTAMTNSDLGIWASGSVSASLGATQSSEFIFAEHLWPVISPTSAKIGPAAQQGDATFSAYNELNDGSTNSLVTLGTVGTSYITLSSTGSVADATPSSQTTGGSTTIEATSQVSGSTTSGTANQAVCSVEEYKASQIASVNSPSGIVQEGNGDLIVADTNDSLLELLTPPGTSWATASYASSAQISELSLPQALALSSAGTLYVSNLTAGDNILELSGSTTGTYLSTLLGTFNSTSTSGPMALALGTNGVYGAFNNLNQIVSFNSSGTGTIVAGNAAFTAGFSADGSQADLADVNSPYGVAVDSSGNVYIADSKNYCVRMVPAANGTYFGKAMSAGDIYTIAGTNTASGDVDGLGTSARFYTPDGMALDASGDIYVVDQNSSSSGCSSAAVRRIAPSGYVTTVASSGSVGDFSALSSSICGGFMTLGSNGTIFWSDYNNNRVLELAPTP